jgi:apolipoprotein N-acyltransferase
MKDLGRALVGGMVAGGLHALTLRVPAAWPLAWIALVPLLCVVERASPPGVFVATLAYSITLFEIDVTSWSAPAGVLYFRMDPTEAWLAFGAGIGAGSIVYGTLLALAFRLRRRAGRPLSPVWCAALWSVWEWLRAYVPPFLPASILGTSQREMLPVLQLASVTGIAGVTALVVATNAAIAGLWAAPPRRAPLAAVAAVVLTVVVWGGIRLTHPTSLGPRVVLVDGAASEVGESTLERYIAATPAVDGAVTALVVWPESALPIDLTEDRAAWTRLSRFVLTLGAPLATGGIGTALADDGEIERFNSVHFVRPGHGMLSYHKQVVIPVAESWPSIFGAPPAALDPIVPGHQFVLFGDGPGRFGPLICFEITDARSARVLAARGARFLVNLNNDAWFVGRDAPHWLWVPVRAVESGRAVSRATNGGSSAIVDPFGRVVAATRATDGPTVLAGAMPDPVDTIYVRSGEVFLPLCLIVVVAGVIPRRRRLTAPGSMAG